MEKQTVLAKLRVNISYSKATRNWFEKLKDQELWFTHDQGTIYFGEFRSRWEKILINSCQPIIDKYFLRLDCPKDDLPHIVVYESYGGSWIMEAAIIMFASVGTAYTILKGLSELPKIADGLTELKARLKLEFTSAVSEQISHDFESDAKERQLPPPPQKPVTTDFVIDARPLLSLTPTEMKTHKIHLSIGISREAFTLENLGEGSLRDIQIGLFKSPTQRNQWGYADSFMGTVPILSSHQTVTKDLSEFRNSSGKEFDLNDPKSLHVDCWVQDKFGIYLFMFYLED